MATAILIETVKSDEEGRWPNPRMDVTAFVGKLLEGDYADLLREGVRVLAQALMETEVSSQIGAVTHERSGTRTVYRNGYRTRTWETRVGTIQWSCPGSAKRPDVGP